MLVYSRYLYGLSEKRFYRNDFFINPVYGIMHRIPYTTMEDSYQKLRPLSIADIIALEREHVMLICRSSLIPGSSAERPVRFQKEHILFAWLGSSGATGVRNRLE
jgi:hypothetical protein